VYVPQIKTIILGEGGVGKTAVTIQKCSRHFVQDYDPTIEDSYRTRSQVDGKLLLWDILDTAGQEEFRSMREQWMRGGLIAIFVYSIIDSRTFDILPDFIEDWFRVKGGWGPGIVLGNKSDITNKREVKSHEGQQLAKRYGFPFFETSAKKRENIDEAFDESARAGVWFFLRSNTKVKPKGSCILL